MSFISLKNLRNLFPPIHDNILGFHHIKRPFWAYFSIDKEKDRHLGLFQCLESRGHEPTFSGSGQPGSRGQFDP